MVAVCLLPSHQDMILFYSILAGTSDIFSLESHCHNVADLKCSPLLEQTLDLMNPNYCKWVSLCDCNKYFKIRNMNSSNCLRHIFDLQLYLLDWKHFCPITVIRCDYSCVRKCIGPRGESRWGIGAIIPLKTYEGNFIHHDFVQLSKRNWGYKAISPSIFLSQKCFEVNFVSLTVANPSWNLTSKYYWNRPA